MIPRAISRGDEHDGPAVFMTVARDEHGDWIAWCVIWSRKLEKKPEDALTVGRLAPFSLCS
jgi:hypothetical protein